MGMPRNLFLVRHGQSEGNLVRKQFEETQNEQFFSDEFLGLHESQYKLTPLGEEQAHKAGEWLRNHGFDRFDRYYVSNNTRAMQTAAYLDLPGADWYQDYNLRERDGGLFNVISPSRRDEAYADQQRFYNSQPFLYRPPQGESIADVTQRINKVLDTLSRECDGKSVIIVCHGHVMRTFRIMLERMPLILANEYLLAEEQWARVPNCSVIHYTRQLPETQNMEKYFNHVRMIRPAGGGKLEDDWEVIKRKRFSNQALFDEAQKFRDS